MSDVNSEKAKALQAALAQIEKQFGKGTIMRLGEGELIEDIQVVSTGSLGLDIACLLYTSDAADDMQCVDLGGRRIIKKRRRVRRRA